MIDVMIPIALAFVWLCWSKINEQTIEQRARERQWRLEEIEEAMRTNNANDNGEVS